MPQINNTNKINLPLKNKHGRVWKNKPKQLKIRFWLIITLSIFNSNSNSNNYKVRAIVMKGDVAEEGLVKEVVVVVVVVVVEMEEFQE